MPSTRPLIVLSPSSQIQSTFGVSMSEWKESNHEPELPKTTLLRMFGGGRLQPRTWVVI